jgi:RNA polymerase sigma factor for flagellar operon FliA
VAGSVRHTASGLAGRGKDQGKEQTMASATTADVGAETIRQWWLEYVDSRSEETRNRLMEHYLPLVKHTAERLATKLPDEVDTDDLISAGVFGLIDAIKAFDLNRGVKFETYCTQRIRGAILDELRSMDWVPRLVRSRTHKLQRARSSLETELGREPTDKELAKRMRLTKAEFTKLRSDARAVGMVSLSRKWFETDNSRDVREIDVLEDKRSENPREYSEAKDIREWVTRGLSRAERLIIILYYFEEMTMKEIGETLALSESRVSQMHSAILERLRQHLSRNRAEIDA